MSAILEVREPSARYLETPRPPLAMQLDLLSRAQGGVARLRELILRLAVEGRLLHQDSGDEPAAKVLERSRSRMREKMSRGEAKREKPSTPVEESEQWFTTPAGWQWCRLTDTGEYVNGLAFKPSDWHPDGLPIIRIQNLSGRNPEFNRTKGEFDRSVIVSAGDILVSWSATLDAFIWQGETGVLNQHIFRVEPAPCVDKGYLFWLLKWAIRDLAESDHAHGLVMSHINRGPFLAKPIPLPPLAEQARIVARVDELMRLCDALEEKGRLEAEQHTRLLSTLLGTLTDSATPEELAANWQRVAEHFDLLLDRPEAVDALEAIVLRAAVRGLLCPSPATPGARSTGEPRATAWTQVRFGSVVEMLNGYAFKSDWFRAQGVRLLRNINVGHGVIDWGHGACVSPEVANEYKRFELAEGDLVLSLDRPIISTGLKLATVRASDLPCLLLQRVARLTPNERHLSRDYLRLWMQSDRFVDSIDPGRSNGVPHISTKQVGELTMDLPSLAEQARIVARVIELRRLCTTLRQRLQAQQATQSHLAEALVEQVLAG